MRAKLYKVTSFTDSTSALRAFEINPAAFDLAVLDHQMPGIDGLELAQNMRQAGVNIPIIMCTSRSAFASPGSLGHNTRYDPTNIHMSKRPLLKHRIWTPKFLERQLH